MVHADDTGGIIWNNFPVMLLGTSDIARQFHPIAVCVCSQKTGDDYNFCFRVLKEMRPDLQFEYSMSDAASAIFNGASANYEVNS